MNSAVNQIDGCFALFDSDDGGAILLSDYRRAIKFDLQADSPDTLEQTFLVIEAASLAGEWVALAVDYGLGACFEPSAAFQETTTPSLRGWVFGSHQRLDAAGVAAFLELQLELLSEDQRHAGVCWRGHYVTKHPHQPPAVGVFG